VLENGEAKIGVVRPDFSKSIFMMAPAPKLHPMTLMKNIAITIIALLLTGCASVSGKPAKVELVFPSQVDLRDTAVVIRRLNDQYREWKSVKYRLGGLTRKGVDCSGFVYLTYLSKFGIKVPKTTELQLKAGNQISQKRLSAGDLVFFRTGYSTRHVGIYLENRRFVHVSEKKGVMISSLDDAYWSKKYWKSIRIGT